MNRISIRTAALVLFAVLVNTNYSSPALAAKNPEKEAQFAEKVKTEIAKLGTGPNARIELKLRDKSKLKGYVSEVSEGSFVVVDDKTEAATTVPYPQVRQVKGNNLSMGVKIAIGIGIVVAVLLIIAPHIAQ